jgi:hypothetical protein
MKLLPIYVVAFGLFFGSAMCTSEATTLSLDSETPDETSTDDPFLIYVIFKDVQFIHTGATAANTSLNQKFSFRVSPRDLFNLATNEHILTDPDVVFVVGNGVFKTQLEDRSQSFQYCLDLLRDMAMNPESGFELTMFLRVIRFAPASGTNFIVRAFVGCGLDRIGS